MTFPMSKASIPAFLIDGLIYSFSFGFSFSVVVLLISAGQSFQGFTSSSPTASPPEPVAASLPAAAEASETDRETHKNLHQKSYQKYYQNLNYFSFSYPADFIVDDTGKNLTTFPENTPRIVVELWQQQKYEAIQNGAYAGGAELPSNVQITVYSNPKQLSLQDWVRSARFVQSGEFQPQTVAGQAALAFSSSGLYEHDNLVFSNPDGTEIIVISLAKVGIGEIDAPNERAFRQILATFTIL